MEILLFSSTTFLFIFLPIVCIVYALVKNEYKNYWLLVASLFFYAWGEPRYLSVMLLIIILNYWTARFMDKINKHSRFILVLGIFLNLSILVFFKYANFIIENLNLITNSNIKSLHIVMPIGISFFIFQAMSYTIDVYRKDVVAQIDIKKLALYISLFPQLIAGPIVKYHDIAYSIDNRNVSLNDVVYGARRFIIGLSKKVLLANNMGIVADKVFATTPDGISLGVAWLGAVAYSLQIFYDFSGYSDMAIGLGRIFGFRFLENFNYPYIARSMTDFWRRWHISLSSWFKDYLYIPLGGNRNGSFKTLRNLLFVFLATGIWHGASWNFVVWGLWHGLFIMLEKLLKKTKIYSYIGNFYVILVFVIGWVLFRSDNLITAFEYIKVMLGFRNNLPHYGWAYYLNTQYIIIGLMAIMFCYPWKMDFLKAKISTEFAYNVCLLVFLVLSMISIVVSSYNPFIYFRF